MNDVENNDSNILKPHFQYHDENSIWLNPISELLLRVIILRFSFTIYVH